MTSSFHAELPWHGAAGVRRYAVYLGAPVRVGQVRPFRSMFPTNMTIELDREEDGRWLTEIPELPGVMAYGRSQLARTGWADFVFAFHDGEEIGPRMLTRIARRTGLRPEDL
jgi:hypothetical protein